MQFPEPVISVAIEPKTKADQDKLGAALGKLAEEDPTFRINTEPETGQTLISGMVSYIWRLSWIDCSANSRCG